MKICTERSECIPFQTSHIQLFNIQYSILNIYFNVNCFQVRRIYTWITSCKRGATLDNAKALYVMAVLKIIFTAKHTKNTRRTQMINDFISHIREICEKYLRPLHFNFLTFKTATVRLNVH